jgi:hypothetical protein
MLPPASEKNDRCLMTAALGLFWQLPSNEEYPLYPLLQPSPQYSLPSQPLDMSFLEGKKLQSKFWILEIYYRIDDDFNICILQEKCHIRNMFIHIFKNTGIFLKNATFMYHSFFIKLNLFQDRFDFGK